MNHEGWNQGLLTAFGPRLWSPPGERAGRRDAQGGLDGQGAVQALAPDPHPGPVGRVRHLSAAPCWILFARPTLPVPLCPSHCLVIALSPPPFTPPFISAPLRRPSNQALTADPVPCRAVPRARRLTQRMLKGLQLAQARPEMKAQVEKVVAVVQVHTAAALCWDFNALWATLPSWLRYCLVLARPPPFSAKD